MYCCSLNHFLTQQGVQGEVRNKMRSAPKRQQKRLPLSLGNLWCFKYGGPLSRHLPFNVVSTHKGPVWVSPPVFPLLLQPLYRDSAHRQSDVCFSLSRQYKSSSSGLSQADVCAQSDSLSKTQKEGPFFRGRFQDQRKRRTMRRSPLSVSSVSRPRRSGVMTARFALN